jgi:GxxExxY protein
MGTERKETFGNDGKRVRGNIMNHSELTQSILECGFEVSNELGIGFLESVYESAMEIALTQSGLSVVRQAPLNVLFRGRPAGRFQIDLLVENLVIVELKAASALIPEHKMQTLNYLRASGLPVALLMNFGTPRMEFRRYENRFGSTPSHLSPSSL